MKTVVKKKNNKTAKTKNLKGTKVNVRVVKKSKPVDLDELISLTQAAELCSYSQEYLSLMSRKGKINSVKTGRNWKISRRELFAYIEEHKEDFAGNNRGSFSKNAEAVVKVYKRDKIISKVIPFDTKTKTQTYNFSKIKNALPVPVVTLLVLLFITASPKSMQMLNGGFNFVNNLFQATVIRGASLSYVSLVETKNILFEMRRFISGESRQENALASKAVAMLIKNESKKLRQGLSIQKNNFNNFVAEKVVAPQLEFLSNKLSLSEYESLPFNILKWNLNSYPEKLASETIINSSVKNKVLAIINNKEQVNGTNARVAGVQEDARDNTSIKDVNQNTVQRFLNIIKSFFTLNK